MTTPAAARLYEAQHVYEMEGKRPAVFNPHGKPIDELPVIYGFSNGGIPGLLNAVALSEDGHFLGGHGCSSEAYIPHDLGILEGTRPDRHETYRKHYPDGYRMEFVGYQDVPNHERLQAVFEMLKEREEGNE